MSSLQPERADSQERLREGSFFAGILPIEKSTKSHPRGFKPVTHSLSPGVSDESQVCEAKNCIQEKGLQDRECANEVLGKSVFLFEEETLEIGKRYVDPRGVWVKNSLVREKSSWLLPGHGEAYGSCGNWQTKGCLNVEGHDQDGLFEERRGKVYIKRFQKSCFRAECPVCYEKWAGKEAGRIAYRLDAWTIGQVIHVVLSPPMRDIHLSYAKLRSKAYLIAKQSGILGGSCIFHPFRQLPISKKWFFSPHFHLLCYGWVKNTDSGYRAHGWVVKNLKVRKSVAGTALYQLSHAGIHGKYHTITWFGKLSYNKLKVPEQPPKEDLCPACSSELKTLWYFGELKLPEEVGSYWVDPEGFRVKPGRGDYG